VAAVTAQRVQPFVATNSLYFQFIFSHRFRTLRTLRSYIRVKMDQTTNHLDAARRAMHEKKPIPEIDFSLHTMEDGAQVSTQERVCKGRSAILSTGDTTNWVSATQRCKHRRFFPQQKTNSCLPMIAASPTYNSSNSISIVRVV